MRPVLVMGPVIDTFPLDITKWIGDINNWIVDIINWIGDITKWISDIKKYIGDISYSFLDITKSEYMLKRFPIYIDHNMKCFASSKQKELWNKPQCFL